MRERPIFGCYLFPSLLCSLECFSNMQTKSILTNILQSSIVAKLWNGNVGGLKSPSHGIPPWHLSDWNLQKEFLKQNGGHLPFPTQSSICLLLLFCRLIPRLGFCKPSLNCRHKIYFAFHIKHLKPNRSELVLFLIHSQLIVSSAMPSFQGFVWLLQWFSQLYIIFLAVVVASQIFN